jgi:signal recognition particle subunit SRP54
MDGDARGGGALSVREVTGKPIMFTSAGEKPDSLEVFHPDRMAKRILGMGDVVSLIETAVKVQAEEDAALESEELMRGNITLNDFITMNKQVRKLGGVSKLISALPGGDKMLNQGQVNEDALDDMVVIINSMTEEERTHPDVLNASRRQRIARGAGVTVTEVNILMKQFNETKKMVKKMTTQLNQNNGKRGKKGKKNNRKSGPLAGLRPSDLKRIQQMMGK